MMVCPNGSLKTAADGFRRIALFVFIAVMACTVESHARVQIDPTAPLELYNDGCDHYEQDDFVGAKDRFLAAALVNWQNPDLFYNLGNCYFRMGDLGRAILYYERAKELAPRDASITHNLDLARSRIVDKIEPSERNILAQMFVDIYSLFNVNEWTVISLALYLALMAVVIAATLLKSGAKSEESEARKGTARRMLVRIGAALLVLGLFCWINTTIKVRAFNARDCGIVVAKAMKARSGPREEFAEVFELHSGTSVRIQASKDGWYQISIETGLSGWLPKESVEAIKSSL